MLFQIPLCNSESDKTSLEDKVLRFSMLSKTLTKLSSNGFDVDDSKNENEKVYREAIIKLFAVSIILKFLGVFINL